MRKRIGDYLRQPGAPVIAQPPEQESEVTRTQYASDRSGPEPNCSCPLALGRAVAA